MMMVVVGMQQYNKTYFYPTMMIIITMVLQVGNFMYRNNRANFSALPAPKYIPTTHWKITSS